MNREDRRGPREDEQPHDQPEMANASTARKPRQRLSPSRRIANVSTGRLRRPCDWTVTLLLEKPFFTSYLNRVPGVSPYPKTPPDLCQTGIHQPGDRATFERLMASSAKPFLFLTT